MFYFVEPRRLYLQFKNIVLFADNTKIIAQHIFFVVYVATIENLINVISLIEVVSFTRMKLLSDHKVFFFLSKYTFPEVYS